MSAPRRQDPASELLAEFSDRLRGDHWQPGIDVFETEKALVVRVELAGVRRDDLRVSVDAGVLRIAGFRRLPGGEEVRSLHQMEIAFGPFERSIRISVPFERERVAAHLEDGFLNVTLPKRSPEQRRIDVES